MRVFIDTNILISAVLNPRGNPSLAYFRAVTHPNHGIVCDQNIDELRRIYNRKFPAKIPSFEQFLSIALITLELVPTPDGEDDREQNIRDVNDRAILRAAICADADILLTGDKDFLASGVTDPRIMSPADFLLL